MSLLLTGAIFLLVVFVLSYLFFKKKERLFSILLFLSLITISSRLYLNVDFETGADASIWISSAQSTIGSENHLWWLFTSNEGRPLTVAPLLLLPAIGIQLTYFSVDFLGLLLYISSFFMTAILITKATKNSLLGCLSVCPMFVVMATTSNVDYTSYNSEAPSLFLFSILLWMMYRITQGRNSSLYLLLFGFLLGSLPFIKFQNSPGGIVIGVTSLLFLWKSNQRRQTLFLIIGAFTPLIILSAFFLWNGEWQSFFNDYFANYFYYSYTTQSSADSFWHRYSPRRILSFILRSTDTIILTVAAFLSISVLILVAVANKKMNRISFFLGVFLLANLYAVIQSGWNSQHYLLYLWLPTSLLLASLYPLVSRFKKMNMALYTLVIAVQIAINVYLFRSPQSLYLPGDAAVSKLIRQYTSPYEKIHIWGYADRLYVLSQRPMGMRLCNNWWLVMEGPMQKHRINEWLSDIENNKVKLIVDNSGRRDPHRIQFRNSSLQKIAQIAKYIQHHYVIIDNIDGAIFYMRKN